MFQHIQKFCWRANSKAIVKGERHLIWMSFTNVDSIKPTHAKYLLKSIFSICPDGAFMESPVFSTKERLR